jgi:hypothetical protein
MKSQATRLTRQEAAYWDHWTDQGHTFQPGEKPPLSTLTAPANIIRHPIRDAVLGLLIIVGVLGAGAYWLARAANLL